MDMWHRYGFGFLFVMSSLCLFVEGNGFSEPMFSDGIGPIYITSEMTLHDTLFPGQKPRKSHPHNYKAVTVEMNIKLLSVVDIESQNEAIVINANIEQKWVNPKFQWNREDFGNISSINVRPEMTWVPDLYVFANIEDDKKYNGLLDTMNTHVIVQHNGKHSWLATVTLRMSCGMDITDFPFDTQSCPLLFGSFTLDTTKLDLIPGEVGIKQYGESPEWVYISMRHKKEYTIYPGSGLPFTDATYTVVMRRKPLYPMTMLVLPNLILAGLTILVFLIPIASGERVMYIFTIFLAVAWYMTSNIETMPSSSQTIPLYTYFLGVSLISLSLLCLSLCFTIVSFYMDPSIKAMPKWVRVFILGQCSRFFNIDVEKKIQVWREDLNLARQYDQHLVEGNSLDGDEVDQTSLDSTHQPPPDVGTSKNDNDTPPDGVLWIGNDNECQSISDIFDKTDVRRLHIMIEEFLQRLEGMEDSRWEQRQWELVAIILDKMFLYFFGSVLALTVFSCTIHVVQLEGYP